MKEFKENMIERETIDMKIYDVPKKYAVMFKQFADENNMKFNSAIILLLERLQHQEDISGMEETIIQNRKLIEELFDRLDNPKMDPGDVKIEPKGWGSKRND